MRLSVTAFLFALTATTAPIAWSTGSGVDILVPEVIGTDSELAGDAAIAEGGWSLIDDKALSVGPMIGSSYQEIAAALTSGLTDDAEKSRAIFRWISEHIEYDVQAFKASLLGDPLSGISAENTLKTRKGVCTGYADLFTAMALHAGLTVKSIGGFAKGWGYKETPDMDKTPNHAWNAVLIDGRWRLLDVTWAAGSVTPDLNFIKRFKTGYFFPDPAEFFKKHEPTQEIWSLLEGDQFKAPVVRLAQADRLDLQVSSPDHGDIEIVSGDAFHITLPERTDLRIGAWLSGADSNDLFGEETAYLPYQTADDGSLIITTTLQTAGTYKLWIGAEPAENEGSLKIALEFNVHVKQGELN